MSGRLRIDYAAVDAAGSVLEVQAGHVGSSSEALRTAPWTYARGAYAALGGRIVAATAGLVPRIEEAFQTCLRAHALAAARITADLRGVDDDLARTPFTSRLRYQVGNQDMPFTGGYGPVSRRPFDPDRAGGPIVQRDALDVTIESDGVDSVADHLRRFVADGEAMDPSNAAMLARLRLILVGELQPTIYDKRFYTHELDEAERYANIGLGGDFPLYGDHLHDAWNNVHTASLEDYGLADLDNYLPELKP